MKLFFLIISVLTLSNLSQANTLKCWKTDFKQAKTPYMVATIHAHNALSDLQFLYKNNGMTNHPAGVVGSLITTNHSPYKGNVDYFLKGTGDLILPPNLSNQNLEAVEKDGIGYYKDENGVIISSVDGDSEGGNHISIRLTCRSDI